MKIVHKFYEETMDYIKVEELLKKYDIQDEQELEDFLEVYVADCEDDEVEGNLCLNKTCFDNGIPMCRRVIEIYKHFYKKDYKKNEFYDYLLKESTASRSQIENWLSCKQCTNTIGDIVGNVKDQFLIEFCRNFEKKFDYDEVFTKTYRSIKVFVKELEVRDSKNFKTKTEKIENKQTMEQIEKDRLFQMINCSIENFKSNLQNEDNLNGSDEYKLNLALEAFECRLDDEALKLLDMIDDTEKLKTNINYLELHAKLLSNKKNDKKAIGELEKLIVLQSEEAHNLLAASIKRDAYNNYLKYDDQDKLIEGFMKAKDIYKKVFNINQNYYPAINIVYLEMMLAYIEADDKKIESKINELKEFWKSVEVHDEDYWSRISNIEFLIITKQYDEAKLKIDQMKQELNEDEISEFMSFATNRQMKMFRDFCNDKELQKIIINLKNL